jgi:membrane protein YdbS with pleckstrin-like domain
MASQWFVRQSSKIYGPFDAVRLKKLAAAGKIAKDSGISKERGGPWTEAERVRGLFPFPSPTSGGESTTSVDEDAPSSVSRRSLFGRTTKQRQPHTVADAGKTMWYFRSDDEDATGPFTTTEIEKLIERGVVRPSTFVLRHGEVKWETAFSAGLFLDDAADDGTESPKPGDPAAPAAAEQVLWKGQASHHVNFGTYVLCAIGAPFYYPAKWGIRRFRERNAIRYEITTQNVRVRQGIDQKQETTVPLSRIARVDLDTPAALRGTRAVNISLFDSDETVLTMLEGVPLDEAARVISLCESAMHHQLRVDASARVLAHQRVEEERAIRLLEQQQRQALRSAQWRAARLDMRASEAEQRARRLQAILGDDCPDDIIERSLTAMRNYQPPRPPRQVSSGGGGWFGLFGGGRGSETTWVRGFYRNGRWVRPHKRRKHR